MTCTDPRCGASHDPDAGTQSDTAATKKDSGTGNNSNDKQEKRTPNFASRCRGTLVRLAMSCNKLPFYPFFRNWYVKRSWTKKVYDDWMNGPRIGVPPHIVKQKNLRRVAREHNLRVLIETGTYYGDMIEAMKNDFDEIYSIEVFEMLHRRAQRRFRKHKSINLILGDSGERLADVIRMADGKPILFWLDGHCSGTGTGCGTAETPIVKELESVVALANCASVIMIDDANCFTGKGAYPELESLKQWVLERMPAAQITVSDNAICIAPRL